MTRLRRPFTNSNSSDIGRAQDLFPERSEYITVQEIALFTDWNPKLLHREIYKPMTTYWFKKYSTDTWRRIESPKNPEQLKATIRTFEGSDELHWIDFGFGRRPVYKVTTQDPTETEDADERASSEADKVGRTDGVPEDTSDVHEDQEVRKLSRNRRLRKR